jgi:hypothetical protein
MRLRYRLRRSARNSLDWAKARSNQVLGQVVAALNGAGNVPAKIIDWAKTAGDAAIQLVGGVLFRAGQTVNDILLWVEKDWSLNGTAFGISGMFL